MDWHVVVALIIAIPVILLPVAFVWYLNIGGIYAAIKAARERKAVRKRGAHIAAGVKTDTGLHE